MNPLGCKGKPGRVKKEEALEQDARLAPDRSQGLEPGQFDEWKREIKRRAPRRAGDLRRQGAKRQPKNGLADPLERQIVYLARRYGRFREDFDQDLRSFWLGLPALGQPETERA